MMKLILVENFIFLWLFILIYKDINDVNLIKNWLSVKIPATFLFFFS